MILKFRGVKTAVDEQIDTIQDGVVKEVNRVIKELDLAIRTLELNDCRPKLSYDHCQSARYILKNLVSDLRLDTRL